MSHTINQTVAIGAYQARIIFGWLRINCKEVDITSADIVLLDHISPLLPDDWAHLVQDLHDKYNEL